jgi:hypothetical protein
MSLQKVSFQIDKSISVPPGKRVIVDYIAVDKIKLGCKDRMSIGDVKEKYELVLQNAPNSVFPTPIGEWDTQKQRFTIIDGRHTTIAYILLGYEHILVSWIE